MLLTLAERAPCSLESLTQVGATGNTAAVRVPSDYPVDVYGIGKPGCHQTMACQSDTGTLEAHELTELDTGMRQAQFLAQQPGSQVRGNLQRGERQRQKQYLRRDALRSTFVLH